MIIGLVAPPGTGKTTVAQEIKNQKATTQLLSFARPIRQAIETMFGQLIVDKNQTPEGLEFSYRTLMQYLGSWGRNLDSEFWIRIARTQVTDNPKWHVVFDDLRFLNEVDFIRQQGGFIVRLDRDEVWNDQSVMEHESEVESASIEEDLYLKNMSPEQAAREILRYENLC